MRVYLDTSAAMKLVVEEKESQALVDELAQLASGELVSSWLLHTELHCAAGRHPEALDSEIVTAVLASVALIDLSRGDLLSAGTHAPLRANHAIHLTVALRVGADAIATYDRELAGQATAAGLALLAPGG